MRNFLLIHSTPRCNESNDNDLTHEKKKPKQNSHQVKSQRRKFLPISRSARYVFEWFRLETKMRWTSPVLKTAEVATWIACLYCVGVHCSWSDVVGVWIAHPDESLAKRFDVVSHLSCMRNITMLKNDVVYFEYVAFNWLFASIYLFLSRTHVLSLLLFQLVSCMIQIDFGAVDSQKQ